MQTMSVNKNVNETESQIHASSASETEATQPYNSSSDPESANEQDMDQEMESSYSAPAALPAKKSHSGVALCVKVGIVALIGAIAIAVCLIVFFVCFNKNHDDEQASGSQQPGAASTTAAPTGTGGTTAAPTDVTTPSPTHHPDEDDKCNLPVATDPSQLKTRCDKQSQQDKRWCILNGDSCVTDQCRPLSKETCVTSTIRMFDSKCVWNANENLCAVNPCTQIDTESECKKPQHFTDATTAAGTTAAGTTAAGTTAAGTTTAVTATTSAFQCEWKKPTDGTCTTWMSPEDCHITQGCAWNEGKCQTTDKGSCRAKSDTTHTTTPPGACAALSQVAGEDASWFQRGVDTFGRFMNPTCWSSTKPWYVAVGSALTWIAGLFLVSKLFRLIEVKIFGPDRAVHKSYGTFLDMFTLTLWRVGLAGGRRFNNYKGNADAFNEYTTGTVGVDEMLKKTYFEWRKLAHELQDSGLPLPLSERTIQDLNQAGDAVGALDVLELPNKSPMHKNFEPISVIQMILADEVFNGDAGDGLRETAAKFEKRDATDQGVFGAPGDLETSETFAQFLDAVIAQVKGGGRNGELRANVELLKAEPNSAKGAMRATLRYRLESAKAAAEAVGVPAKRASELHRCLAAFNTAQRTKLESDLYYNNNFSRLDSVARIAENTRLERELTSRGAPDFWTGKEGMKKINQILDSANYDAATIDDHVFSGLKIQLPNGKRDAGNFEALYDAWASGDGKTELDKVSAASHDDIKSHFLGMADRIENAGNVPDRGLDLRGDSHVVDSGETFGVHDRFVFE